MTELNINEIKTYLPHRYPFLLVDKILDYTIGEKIIGIKNVTANESFFNGHFPQSPIMPGVLIIEAMAQTAGILIFLSGGTKPDAQNLFFLAGVDNARFKRVVIPGDQLRFEATMTKSRHNIWVFKAEAFVADKLVCEAELMVAKEGK
jgi:3-hydroxyacyl-[acyl-carrier-protein] dehydratase